MGKKVTERKSTIKEITLSPKMGTQFGLNWYSFLLRAGVITVAGHRCGKSKGVQPISEEPMLEKDNGHSPV